MSNNNNNNGNGEGDGETKTDKMTKKIKEYSLKAIKYLKKHLTFQPFTILLDFFEENLIIFAVVAFLLLYLVLKILNLIFKKKKKIKNPILPPETNQSVM